MPDRDDTEANREVTVDPSIFYNHAVGGDVFCKLVGADVVSDMSVHTFLLYAVVIESDAKEVFEIGVCDGRSTRALLCAVAMTGGNLTSIDIRDFRNPIALDGLSPDLKRRWTFHQADSNVYHQKLEGKSLDVLMIDGLHSYNQVRRDFDLYSPYVRQGGYICMHDILSLEGPNRVFAEADPSKWEKMSFSQCLGFGLLRRR